MSRQECDYGMIGLGTMGRNLVFNMNDHGYSVAGFDKDVHQVEILARESTGRTILSTSNLNDFIGALKTPRCIILLVPAGAIVDAVIEELKPLLTANDLLMDCGNSYFTDTTRRASILAEDQIYFMGIGVSGGESGARYGPSIMPGGEPEAYERVSEMLTAVAAKVNDEPCVTLLGKGAAGHYVKMVHNGIEYAIMQLIAEAYHILKTIGGLDNDELSQVFTKWNQGPLQSFLIEITADIFVQKDDLTGNRLLDMILDTAHQKGTGAWTSGEAMKMQVPLPVIDMAVTMRNLSSLKNERLKAELVYGYASKGNDAAKKELIDNLEHALSFAMIISYAQGMSLLSIASEKYGYGLNLADVARIWRGGCIIRAALLEKILAAYEDQPQIANILLNEGLAADLTKAQTGMRKTLISAIDNGIPVPTMASALNYFDAYRSGWLPANLLQAQRDYFGAHTYERIDIEGKFHTDWSHKK